MQITKHDAIKCLSNAIAYAKVREETWADNIYVPALEVAVRVMATEPKKGKWLTVENPNYSPFDCSPEKITVCSVCGYTQAQQYYNYCPNCGSENEREINE